jgi:hypothetical protein
VIHTRGECTIIQIVDDEDSPLSNYVEGALQYQDGTVYWDTGSALEVANSLDHGELAGLSDNDHPQYILIAGDTAEGSVAIASVEGLSTDGVDYTATYPLRVMSLGGHTDTDVDGLSYHSGNIYTRAVVNALTSKESFALNNGGWNYTADTVTVPSGDYSDELPSSYIVSCPYLTGVTGTGAITFRAGNFSAGLDGVILIASTGLSATANFKELA